MENENYFFDIEEKPDNDKVFVLIIYDIVDNKRRLKLAKFLAGYGFRVQKSAFEAVNTFLLILRRMTVSRFIRLLEKVRWCHLAGRWN